MIEAHYRTGPITFKVTGENQKAIFRELASIQDVFDAEQKCGCCDSSSIRFQVRTIEDNDFYELICLSCYARLQFGQHKKGNSLYVKRKAEDGSLLANRGWAKYEPRKHGVATQRGNSNAR